MPEIVVHEHAGELYVALPLPCYGLQVDEAELELDRECERRLGEHKTRKLYDVTARDGVRFLVITAREL
jgi:hypothetical protein